MSKYYMAMINSLSPRRALSGCMIPVLVRDKGSSYFNPAKIFAFSGRKCDSELEDGAPLQQVDGTLS
jgi:hypothetical protein